MGARFSSGASHQALCRRIVEHVDVGIWVLDPHGVTTFANDKTSAILGYTADEMAGLSLFDVLDEPGRAAAVQNLERRRQGMSDQLECGFTRRDGSLVWVLLNASPLSDDEGNYVGPVCVMSEITDRRHIEDALHHREQQLSEAQRLAHLGSWEWDVASDRTSWSDELYRMFGLTPDRHEPTYEGYLARLHPDDVDLVKGWVANAMNGADRFEGENRILRPGGETAWIHARGEVERDDSGAPVRMRGTAQDITATKLAEEELKRTTARYRLLEAMASAANEASSVADVLQTAVDEICVHSGWPVGHVYLAAEDDPGVLVSSGIWHVDEPERFEELRRVTSATSFRAERGVVGARQGDAPAWVGDVSVDPSHVRANATPDLGVRGHIAFPVRLAGATVAVVEFFSTDVLEPDQALLDTLGQLGTQLSRVAERQRAATELASARDAAMASVRAKSDFMATMSHEIRTPMNAVIGLTGLLLGTPLDDRQRQYVEGVRDAGEALLGVINDILDFSKIEAGKVALEVVDFDLVQVIEEAAELVAEAARRKGLELVAYCHPNVPPGLRGDPARLRQILLNLAANAVKFTDRGEVVVRARRVDEHDDAVVVRFEVVDTGIGIAEADPRRLFEPFSQADASTTRRFGGTGLGLAISTRLVNAMGGEIGVDSEPGRGATFWFTVPLGRSAAGAVTPARPFHHLLDGRRVLVVDDNATNRMILGEQLSAWAMRPSLVSNGPAALERMRAQAMAEQPYDLAVLDMCMDEMDGLELARRISAEPILATTRLVLLTSTTRVGIDEARRAGIQSLLTKPVHLSQLYDCLMRLTAPAHGSNQEPEEASVSRHGTAADRGHVLVVEDSTANQMVALGILENLGYSADAVANGLEALKALERADYAAVLMDCQMPEMDGYTATGAIRRRQDRLRGVPIIAMTAGVIEGDRERCLRAGMDDYIAKPINPEALDAALARWVVGRSGDQAAAAGDDDASPPDATIDHERVGVLRAMGSADSSLLPRLVEAFLDEAPAHVAHLVDAVRDGDAAGLCEGAHRLRGTAANLGAVRLAELLRRLESLGREGRLDEATGPLSRLKAEVDLAGAALRAALEPEA